MKDITVQEVIESLDSLAVPHHYWRKLALITSHFGKKRCKTLLRQTGPSKHWEVCGWESVLDVHSTTELPRKSLRLLDQKVTHLPKESLECLGWAQFQ